MNINFETPDFILLNIGHARHYADWNYQNVHSPFARIYLIKEGHANLHLPGKVIPLQPGHLYIIPPFTTHSYECHDYFSLYYIHIYEQESRFRVLEEFVFPSGIEASEIDIHLCDRLLRINPGRELVKYDPRHYDNSSTLLKNISIDNQQPAYKWIETKGILFQIFSRFLKNAHLKHTISDDRIKKALRHIWKNIHTNISIEELADLCCMSPDHFIRLFKKELEETPIRYINHKKIENAQLKLITTRLSIKDIAYSLAFENISYFNRIFKKITGKTPSDYQREL